MISPIPTKVRQRGRLASSLEKRITRELVGGVLEIAVRDGRIDPRNKSEEQIRLELAQFIFSKHASRITLTIDHTSDLLSRARGHRKSAEPWLACLFYAIWFEHLLNLMINSIVARRRLPSAVAKQMMRDLPFQAKIGWLWPVLGTPPINNRHREVLKTLAELRNSFVHYKWTYAPADSSDVSRSEAIKLLVNIEKTVAYMRRYDQNLLLHGSKARLNRAASVGAAEKKA